MSEAEGCRQRGAGRGAPDDCAGEKTLGANGKTTEKRVDRADCTRWIEYISMQGVLHNIAPPETQSRVREERMRGECEGMSNGQVREC